MKELYSLMRDHNVYSLLYIQFINVIFAFQLQRDLTVPDRLRD